MDQPLLKLHWERFKAHVDLDVNTAAKLIAPILSDHIERLDLLSEGCANTNYKVNFKNNRLPVVIRIYMRENSALQREIAIHKLVAVHMPVPEYFYADDQCIIYPYAYAIVEWIDGTLMREVVLSRDTDSISQSLFSAGKYLDELRKITFSYGGFFQEDLKIRSFAPEEKYYPYVCSLLEDQIVRDSLGEPLLKKVSSLVKNYSNLLPDENIANLTHGDYDPANMLVKEVNGKWQIASILDWEFAFSGTYLLDMGLMLRYSHKLPSCYEQSFIAGVQNNGFKLPFHWKKQAKLMDLLCLLQLTHYNPMSVRPKLNRDVVSLIDNTIVNWNDYQ